MVDFYTSVEFPVRGAAPGRCSLCANQVGIQRILPLDYSTMHLPPLVGITSAEAQKGSQVAVLPLNSPVVAAMKEMEVSALSMQCNVEVSLVSCSCGDFHVSLITTTDLCRGDILVPCNLMALLLAGGRSEGLVLHFCKWRALVYPYLTGERVPYPIVLTTLWRKRMGQIWPLACMRSTALCANSKVFLPCRWIVSKVTSSLFSSI